MKISQLSGHLMSADKNIYRIKVLTIFSPSVMIATWDSTRIPPTSAYLALEHCLSRDWAHAPAWNFERAPKEGMLVLVMTKNKTNFKRGVILHMEEFAERTLIYSVFLYDWGIIEGFTVDQLAQLKPDHERALLPRTFILIGSGLVPYQPHLARKRVDDSQEQLLDQLHRGRLRRHRKLEVVKYSDGAYSATRKWLDSRSCYLRLHKTYQSIVYTGDIKIPVDRSTEENGYKKGVPQTFYNEMEHQGLVCLDPSLRKEDKNQEYDNWSSILARMSCINFDEIARNEGKTPGAAPRLHEQFGGCASSSSEFEQFIS